NDWPQTSHIHVDREQPESVVDQRPGLEQERKIGGEYGYILRARLPKDRHPEAFGRSALLLGDGVDGDEAEIFDAVGDFADRRRRNLSAHDLPALGQRAVAKIGHRRHRSVVTRRISAAEVNPVRHLAMPSSTMVVMPARMAASSIATESAWAPTRPRTSSVISSTSNTPLRPR